MVLLWAGERARRRLVWRYAFSGRESVPDGLDNVEISPARDAACVAARWGSKLANQESSHNASEDTTNGRRTAVPAHRHRLEEAGAGREAPPRRAGGEAPRRASGDRAVCDIARGCPS